MSGDIITKLYGSNNYRPVNAKQELYKKGTIIYCGTPIKVNDILCIREAPNSNVHPKSIVTVAEQNPETGTSTITEYEYSGSQGQWVHACKIAQEEGISHIDIWA